MSEYFSLFLTQNKLMELARFEARWDDYVTEPVLPDSSSIEVESPYPMNLDDLTCALENIVEDNLSVIEFFLLWYIPVTDFLYRHLMLNEIIVPDAKDLKHFEPSSLPDSDEEMMQYVFRGLAEVEYLIGSEDTSVPVEPALCINEMLDAIDLYYENQEKPLMEREFTDLQKLDFLGQWDNNMMLEDASKEIKTLFRRFTDELTEKKNFFAMRIKAYACYEGNAVYKQDNAEAARLLEILWKDYSFAYAANTLGYIYYYGRLDPKGKPDYEKAFFYYSVASTYGIIEAKYKLSDMFLNGHYVAPNRDLAKDILMDLYGGLRFKFENGDYACEFADVAFRIGKFFESAPGDDSNVLIAYLFYMQADFAIKKRIEAVHQFYDKKIQDNITRALDSAREFARPTTKSTYHTDFPSVARDFVSGRIGCCYGVSLKTLKSGNIKVEIERLSGTEKNPNIPKSLICMPWFEYTALVDKVSFILENVIDAYGVNPEGSTGYLFDNVDIISLDEHEFKITFSASIDTVVSITAGSVRYSKPKN